jgi:hypothetical protein
MIGQTISQHRIDEQLGTGGMGNVYRVEDSLWLQPLARRPTGP